MEERKGLFTPDGEKTIDRVAKFSNKFIETIDGPSIQIIDNQLLQKIKEAAEAKYPGISEEFLYPIADTFIGGLDAAFPED